MNVLGITVELNKEELTLLNDLLLENQDCNSERLELDLFEKIHTTCIEYGCFDSEKELRKKAIKMLADNNELFDRLAFCCTSCICDVHLYPMESLDDFFGVDETLTEIIDTLDRWFDTNDDFFYEADGMLYSITDTGSLFKKHFSAEEVLDRAIKELDADLQMDDEFDEVFRALKKAQ